MIRKKDLLGNYIKRSGVRYTHSIQKCAAPYAGYAAILRFLPGTAEIRVDCQGAPLLIAAPGFTWLMYLPMKTRWCMTAIYDPQMAQIEWYFDAHKGCGVDEGGMPWFDDLYLDLVILPDGQRFTLDADELQEALDEGSITRADFEDAYATLDEVLAGDWGDVDFLVRSGGALLEKFQQE